MNSSCRVSQVFPGIVQTSDAEEMILHIKKCTFPENSEFRKLYILYIYIYIIYIYIIYITYIYYIILYYIIL